MKLWFTDSIEIHKNSYNVEVLPFQILTICVFVKSGDEIKILLKWAGLNFAIKISL